MIRRARLSDVSDMATCVDAAYASARRQGIALPPVSEGLDQDVRDHLVWVFVQDDTILGMIVVAVNEDSGHLVNIAVHPRAGGRGIAKFLIETAITELRRLSIGRIKLSTHVDMPENVALYTHLGWVETGRSRTKVQMARDIA